MNVPSLLNLFGRFHRQRLLVIECIGRILHEYLSPEVWDLPVDHKPSYTDSEVEISSRFFRDTAMLHQAVAEIANASKREASSLPSNAELNNVKSRVEREVRLETQERSSSHYPNHIDKSPLELGYHLFSLFAAFDSLGFALHWFCSIWLIRGKVYRTTGEHYFQVE